MEEAGNKHHHVSSLNLISHIFFSLIVRNSQVSLGCSSLYLLAAWACLVSATALCEFVKVTGTDITTGGSQTISRGIWKGSQDIGLGCGGYGGVYRDAKVSK